MGDEARELVEAEWRRENTEMRQLALFAASVMCTMAQRIGSNEKDAVAVSTSAALAIIALFIRRRLLPQAQFDSSMNMAKAATARMREMSPLELQQAQDRLDSMVADAERAFHEFASALIV